MKRNTRLLIALLITELLTTTRVAFADPTESYGDIVGRKLTSSLANLTTSTLELPKNIITQTNAPGSNFIYGLAGGTMLGVLHTMGRMTVGIMDLVTAPIPTRPIANPLYVWDDFDVNTTYGPIFRLQDY
jgi:putative exosortase-associated protein (TIGR04073 family)